jgi:uncharacterized repeat protein (TIGR02543 family)
MPSFSTTFVGWSGDAEGCGTQLVCNFTVPNSDPVFVIAEFLDNAGTGG